MNRSLPPLAADAVLVVCRLLVGIVLLAHGWQKLAAGIAVTSAGFAEAGVPLATAAAAFVTLAEVVGGGLLVAGAFTTVASGVLFGVMLGAAVVVHVPNGIFVQKGGWELVGVIGAGLLVFAAAGPGRYSVDHLVGTRHRRAAAAAADLTADVPPPPRRPAVPVPPRRPVPVNAPEPTSAAVRSDADADAADPGSAAADPWAEAVFAPAPRHRAVPDGGPAPAAVAPAPRRPEVGALFEPATTPVPVVAPAAGDLAAPAHR